jgi:hypothetical protein
MGKNGGAKNLPSGGGTQIVDQMLKTLEKRPGFSNHYPET